ncbi:MAG: cysteine dioxygenase family protein [Candidatus Binatia bacterium]
MAYEFATKLSLTDLIGLLQRDVSVMTRTRMIEVLQRLIVTEEEIAEHASFSEHRYSRNIVVRDKQFEILMICWKSGQRSLIHDHGDSLGGVKVLRGILTESLFTPALNGMIKPVTSTDYQSGDVQIEEKSTIHQVSNLQPGGRDAISLHAYLPPFGRMNIYRLYDIDARSVSAELHNYGTGI